MKFGNRFRSPRHLYFPDVGLLPFIATSGGGGDEDGNGYDEFFGDLAAAAVSGDATIDYDAFVREARRLRTRFRLAEI